RPRGDLGELLRNPAARGQPAAVRALPVAPAAVAVVADAAPRPRELGDPDRVPADRHRAQEHVPGAARAQPPAANGLLGNPRPHRLRAVAPGGPPELAAPLSPPSP